MSLFLDASAIVAVLAREPEAHPFDKRIEREDELLTSAVAMWEATRGLSNARNLPFAEARDIVAAFLREFDVRLIVIGKDEGERAIEAHDRFGKGHHAASLNIGDCFAYACAKLHADEILFKGEDFIHTDLKDAMLP